MYKNITFKRVNNEIILNSESKESSLEEDVTKSVINITFLEDGIKKEKQIAINWNIL